MKKRPKPLAGVFFSRDQMAIDHFVPSLSFGGGEIIETMPFGGVGYSGIGHYYGSGLSTEKERSPRIWITR